LKKKIVIRHPEKENNQYYTQEEKQPGIKDGIMDK